MKAYRIGAGALLTVATVLAGVNAHICENWVMLIYVGIVLVILVAHFQIVRAKVGIAMFLSFVLLGWILQSACGIRLLSLFLFLGVPCGVAAFLNISHKVVQYCMWSLGLVAMLQSPLVFLSARGEPHVAVWEHGKWGRAEKHDGGLNVQAQYSYDELHHMLGATQIFSAEHLSQFNELWLITPTTPFSRNEIVAIHHWVASGGHLVVVADHTDLFGHAQASAPLLSSFGLSIHSDCVLDCTSEGGTYFYWAKRYAGLTACSIGGRAEAIMVQAGFSERTDYSKRSFFSDYMISNEERSGLFPVLVRSAFGLGQVTLFGDSTLFANFALVRPSAQGILDIIVNPSAAESVYFYLSLASLLFVAGLGGRRNSVIAACILSAFIFLAWKGEAGHRSQIHSSDVSITGDWSLVEGANAPYATLMASAYSKAHGIPVWHGSSSSSGVLFVNGKSVVPPELSRLPDERSIFDRLNARPAMSSEDFVHALQRDSAYSSFWFDEGVGIMKEIAYGNFWARLLDRAESPIVQLDSSRGCDAFLYGDAKEHVLCHLVITTLSGLTEWLVVGDWVIGKRLSEDTILIRANWQHPSWRFGDCVLKLEKH